MRFYKNNTTKLDFQCKNGHKFKTTWGCVLQGSFCKICSFGAMEVIDEIILFCMDYELELLLNPSYYRNAKAPLKFKCLKCNTEFTTGWWNLQKKNIKHC